MAHISSTLLSPLVMIASAILLATTCTVLLPGCRSSPQTKRSRLACIAVPTPAASVVMRCAFSTPTRCFHSFRNVWSLVALRIVVTLGRLSPSGVRYTRLRVMGSLTCSQFLYWKRSTNCGGVNILVILYILHSIV